MALPVFKRNEEAVVFLTPVRQGIAPIKRTYAIVFHMNQTRLSDQIYVFLFLFSEFRFIIHSLVETLYFILFYLFIFLYLIKVVNLHPKYKTFLKYGDGEASEASGELFGGSMDRRSRKKPDRGNGNEEEGEAEAVIIGGMVLDIQASPSIPPNPRTTAPGKVQYAAGGVARNIAECVSKLGTKPYMISALGLDMPGNLLLEYWKSAGLSLEGIRMGHEIETPVVCIIFDTEGEPAAGVASVESVERFLTPEWIVQFKCNIASAPIVMVDANLSPPALKTSCQLAAEAGTPVWFEPVSVAKSKRIASVAKYVTFISPNEDEVISMANSLSSKLTFSPIKKNNNSTISSLFQQLKPAIWVLLENGIKVVILTLGSKGVLLCSKGRFDFQHIGPRRNNRSHEIGKMLHETISQLCPSDRFFSALRLEERSSISPYVVHLPAVECASVVRLTGAGDCLVGGAVASICAGLDVMQSVAVGIAAAKGAVEAETNVPNGYSLDQIAADARSAYMGAKVVFCESML